MEKYVRFGPVLGGILMFTAALIVCLELFLRNLFNTSLGGADEISSYLFAVSVAWSLPFVILSNTNIRVDIFVTFIPRWMQDWVLRFGTLLLGVFLAALAARAVQMAWLSYQTNAHSVTPLQTPLAIPQTIWAAGLCVAVIAVIIQLFRKHQATNIDDEIQEIEEQTKE